MMRKSAIAAVIALAVWPALAQTPPAGTPTRIRGTVDKLDGQNLMVKSRDGQTLTIELAANVAVITLVKKSIADIKAGDYVASTGVKGTDGKIHAIEVRISDAAGLRHVPETRGGLITLIARHVGKEDNPFSR